MKKFIWLFVLVAIAAGVMYFLTRAEKTRAINSGFTRQYHTATIASTIEAPYNIDVLGVWNNTIVGYCMRSKYLLQLDTNGKLLHKIHYRPAPNAVIHSMSGDSSFLYCFDIGTQSVYRTNFADSLMLVDSLPPAVMSCVKNPGDGFMLQRYNKNGTSLETYKSNNGIDIIYSFKDFQDWGVTHRGHLYTTESGKCLVYLPFYNSEVLQYDYAANHVSKIITIDKSPVLDMSIGVPHGRIISSKAPVINRKAAANDQFLFVLSYARSATDTTDQPLVDVYSMQNGNYRGSIAVPGIRGKTIATIACLKNKLVVGLNHKLFILPVDEETFHPR